MEQFSIIEYLSGLTAFVFDEAVLKRIATDRGVLSVTSPDMLDQKTRDLLFADILFTVYCSPNTIASQTNKHGAFTQAVGSQTVTDKESIYNVMVGLYKKWGDEKLDLIPDTSSYLHWME